VLYKLNLFLFVLSDFPTGLLNEGYGILGCNVVYFGGSMNFLIGSDYSGMFRTVTAMVEKGLLNAGIIF
jgi:hypothetical protein